MLFLQSAPHLALQKYIEQYNYVSFNSCELPSLKQTFLPYDIPAISFFIGPVFLQHGRDDLTGPIIAPDTQSAFAYFNALTTSSNSFYFKDDEYIKVIIIQFKPSGFSSLFYNNMSELTNLLPDFLSLAGNSEGFYFLEQLMESEGFTRKVSVIDKFLLNRLTERYNSSDQIREACRKLIITNGLIGMKDLSYHTNMSLRTLERQFKEQVGVSPKLFGRFKRFHHALALMNRVKHNEWTDIAYECGYYDQAHFIKEFKSFSGQSPSSYNSPEYALYNQIILQKYFSSF